MNREQRRQAIKAKTRVRKDFTNALQQYLSIDKATATIMQQAEEATRAMSKDIPDLEGAELKV